MMTGVAKLLLAAALAAGFCVVGTGEPTTGLTVNQTQLPEVERHGPYSLPMALEKEKEIKKKHPSATTFVRREKDGNWYVYVLY